MRYYWGPFICSIPKSFKKCTIRLQVTRDIDTILFAVTTPHLALADASEMSHVNSPAVFLKNSKYISSDCRWPQTLHCFCLKGAYLSWYWCVHRRFLMSIHVQHSLEMENMYDQSPSDFGEVHFLLEISIPNLAGAHSCEITAVKSLAIFLKNWKSVWSDCTRLHSVKYLCAWIWNTSPCTGGSIRDFPCQFLCRIPKKFKTHIIRLQVTSGSYTFLLDISIPHLAKAPPSGIAEVSSSAAFLKTSKHVRSDSNWLPRLTPFCLKLVCLTLHWRHHQMLLRSNHLQHS